MSSVIRTAMRARGISGNELARRLGVTAGAISQLLSSEQDETIKLHSLRRAMRAMEADIDIETRPSRISPYSPRSISEAIEEALRAGDDTFAFRLLTLAGQEAVERPDLAEDPAFELPPVKLFDHRWDTFTRAYLQHLFPQRISARWPRPEKLQEPWFVFPDESLKRKALRSTPDYLRTLNIFIDENSMSRA